MQLRTVRTVLRVLPAVFLGLLFGLSPRVTGHSVDERII